MGIPLGEKRRAEEALRQNEASEELFREVDRQILQGQPLDAILSLICERLAAIFAFPVVWIGRKQADGSVSIAHRAGAQAQGFLQGLRVRWDETPEGQGPTGRAIRTGRTDTRRFEALPIPAWRVHARRCGLTVAMAIPLRVRDEILGALVLDAERPETFGDDTIGRLETLAARVDVALQTTLHQELLRLQGAAMAAAANAIFITDRAGEIEWINGAFTQLTGYTAEEAIGQTPRLLKSGTHDERYYRQLWGTILSGRVWRDECVNRHKDGHLHVVHQTITPLRDASGRVTHFVAVHEDITARKQAEDRIAYLAYHDPLTELPNRLLFRDRLRQALVQAHRRKNPAAVLFLDLDRFKDVNDSFGHQTGDGLLQAVARRLVGNLRESDTIARLSGDEFAIVLPDLPTGPDAMVVAQKLLGSLSQAFDVGGQEIFLSASIGITLYPLDGTDPDSLLKNADVAMYRAKELGRNNYQFYKAEMTARAVERLDVEKGLRRALASDELRLHYQPVVELATGRIAGAEALLRWERPGAGLALPDQFIPIAEETGLILPIGEWVLHAACVELKRWRDAGLPVGHVSVNVSARHFFRQNLVERIERVLRETGLDGGCLGIEITESSIMENPETAAERLQALKRLGVRVAIDDFGTGYSSLSSLRRFPVTTLKIDRSFVLDCPDDPDDAAIAATVIAMAHSLRIVVVAKGVETAEQLAFLRERACDQVQGFFCSPPVPPEEIMQILEAGTALRPLAGSGRPHPPSPSPSAMERGWP